MTSAPPILSMREDTEWRAESLPDIDVTLPSCIYDGDWLKGEPSAFEQIAGMPGDVGDIASGLYNDSVALGEGWAAGSSSVSERSDVSSYLVTPVSMTSEMDSLRWSAGPLLGGIDWIVEKLCGFSVL